MNADLIFDKEDQRPALEVNKMSKMSLSRRVAMITAPLAFLSLAACATPFQANVQRFQQMPPAQGQSFRITSGNPDLNRSLEFQHYAGLVEQKMSALGYRPAAGGQADLVVQLDYGVDKGRERIVSDPFNNDPFWGPWGGYRGFGGYGRPYGYGGRWHRPYMWGFNDPFLYGPGWNSSVRSYTVYVSHLGMTIERAGTKERLFEGSAEALSRDNDLTYLVPNLIDSMFTGFPGNGGEKVKISLPPKKR